MTDLAEKAPAEAEPVEETTPESPSDWGAPGVVARREFKCFWFHLPDGSKFTHLDLTGKEALALEERFPGVSWGELRPSVLAQRMALLETFLARTDPDHAADIIGALTIQQIEDAVTSEYSEAPDDLPEMYQDGLPKATAGP